MVKPGEDFQTEILLDLPQNRPIVFIVDGRL